MASKRHPLEIFNEHKKFAVGSQKNGSRTDRQGKRPGSKHGAKDRTKRGGQGRGAYVSFGDQRITLSLNGLLIMLLGVVAVSLGMYLLGYYKVIENQEPVSLKGSLPVGTSAEPSSQPSDDNMVRSDGTEDVIMQFGVQVGVWDAKRDEIAEEANEWLKKKGFESRIRALKNKESYCIIVGSFAESKDQELLKLLEDLRSVDDYPHGDPSPFEDAKIVCYRIE